jgi:LysR family transcriptional regulator of beta-lactamase
VELMAAPQSPLCAPEIAGRLRKPDNLRGEILLRSYRTDEWERWFASVGVPSPKVRGTVFDSSIGIAEAAVQGAGVALLPVAMFTAELRKRRLIQPFKNEIALGSYWLTSLKSKRETSAMKTFHGWLLAQASGSESTTRQGRNR